MNTSSSLSHLRQAFEAAGLEVDARALDVDGEYVRRGFLAVGAIIERDIALFGDRGYTLFKERQLENEGYLKTRETEDIWAEELDRARRVGAIDEVIERLRLDQTAHARSKLRLIGRYAPRAYSAMLEPYRERIRAAALQERQTLCAYCSVETNQRLFNREEVPRRKEIWNAVATQAFGELGFTVRSQRKGVCSFWKRLDDRYAMLVEVDLVHLEAVGQDFGQDYGDTRGFSLQLTTLSKMVSADKRDRRELTAFPKPYITYAWDTYHVYGDARSMEVAVRAAALEHELRIAPFERAIQEAVQKA